MLLAITLKPRQDRINFGDQIRRALINTVAGTGDSHHKRIDSSMFEYKYLSEVGFCSRRKADDYISAGRVYIIGVKSVLGSRV